MPQLSEARGGRSGPAANARCQQLRIADGTLVDIKKLAFPKIPNVSAQFDVLLRPRTMTPTSDDRRISADTDAALYEHRDLRGKAAIH